MTNELEKTFFNTFGIKPKSIFKGCTLGAKYYSEICEEETCKGCDCEIRETINPQITDHILLELICLNNIYLWETHTSTVNELKNVLLNKYIEHVNLMADENEKQEYINLVRALFEESK